MSLQVFKYFDLIFANRNDKPAGLKELRSQLDNTQRIYNGKAITYGPCACSNELKSFSELRISFERRTIKIIHDYGEGLYKSDRPVKRDRRTEVGLS
jgi:hypothetical protein